MMIPAISWRIQVIQHFSAELNITMRSTVASSHCMYFSGDGMFDIEASHETGKALVRQRHATDGAWCCGWQRSSPIDSAYSRGGSAEPRWPRGTTVICGGFAGAGGERAQGSKPHAIGMKFAGTHRTQACNARVCCPTQALREGMVTESRILGRVPAPIP